MPRLIDADALFALVKKNVPYIYHMLAPIVAITHTIDAEPVRHGCNCKVITHPYADGYSIEVDSKRSELSIWEGHVCLGVFHADYCPNCGAKMDGGKENDCE